MEGLITEDMNPILKIRVRGSQSEVTTYGILDTGFNGELCVPIETAVKLGLELVSTAEVIFADGRREEELVFSGELYWFGNWKKVKISLTKAQEVLLGIRLLRWKSMNMNFCKGTVEIDECD